MKRSLCLVQAATLLILGLATSLSLAASPRIVLHEARQLETDLEIGGDLSGLHPGSTRYLTYSDLLRLPQVEYTVSDDGNFSGATKIGGVALTELIRDLGDAVATDFVVAICNDGYRTNYPSAYLAAHRPVLVLRINGRTMEGWPKSRYGHSLGPYLISHPKFTPSFRILSHTDEPQIPFGVVRLEFRGEQAVFGAIFPPGGFSADDSLMAGYRIAQQNCFRCHNMGAEGGQMAGRSWQVLAMWASTEPDFFSRFVKNPKSVDVKSRMPGFPDYDAETIEVLRRYFASFAPPVRYGASR
jgi:hypothetical protein